MASFPTATDPCIYKSVTLAAGEQFNLPPGAVLISATDISAITSTCPIPALEQVTAFSARFSGSADNSGSNRYENWETGGDRDNYTVEGVRINGVYYGFASAFQGRFNTDVNVVNALNALFPGMFSDCGSIYDADNPSGWTNAITFKTIPSFGNDMEFRIATSVFHQGPTNGRTTAWVRAYPTAGYPDGPVPGAC